MVPALFLDRDGVIIENREQYVRKWSDVAFIPGALQALASVKTSRFKIILVTNQSAIGRGIITASLAQEINQRMCQIIEQAGGRIDAVYVCPHTPSDRCACRKPQPGLLLNAARDLAIDLNRSILIGDALEDLLAGQNAGLERTILVLTGRGSDQLKRADAPPSLKPYAVSPTLSEALASITDYLLSS